jgi:hypothetical protein
MGTKKVTKRDIKMSATEKEHREYLANESIFKKAFMYISMAGKILQLRHYD